MRRASLRLIVSEAGIEKPEWMIMGMQAGICIALFLGLGGFLVFWLIAADSKRYLVRFDLATWHEQEYLGALPNFLQALHDHNFNDPWPMHPNAVNGSYFAYRVRPILKIRPSLRQRNFVFHHLGLEAIIQNLNPYIKDAIMAEQMRLAVHQVIKMEDTADRDRLLEFIDAVRDYRAAFEESLTEYDRALLAEMKARHFMETLRSTHAIFQEHGFTLLPEFTMLRRWEDLTGAEIVQELPSIPRARGQRKSRSHLAATRQSGDRGSHAPLA